MACKDVSGRGAAAQQESWQPRSNTKLRVIFLIARQHEFESGDARPVYFPIGGTPQWNQLCFPVPVFRKWQITPPMHLVMYPASFHTSNNGANGPATWQMRVCPG